MEELFQKNNKFQQSKILALGKNYIKHVQQMGGKELSKESVIFQKPFTSIYLVDKTQVLELPELGHEIEILIYTIKSWFHDQQIRQEHLKRGLIQQIKNQRPILKSKDSLETYQKERTRFKILIISLQNYKTSSMNYKIADLICYIYKFMILNQGDLLLTGTYHRVRPVKQNDQLNGILKQDDIILTRIDLQIQ